jgi:Ca-activated chloride channel family protein
MKTPNRPQARILFIAALIFLHGCSSSTLSDKEKDTTTSPGKMSRTTVPALQPHLAEEKSAPLPSLALPEKKAKIQGQPATLRLMAPASARETTGDNDMRLPEYRQLDQESYNALGENPLVVTVNDPLSTFSIDVDTASYSNVRRFLTAGTLPPSGAVRIEEMINYFSYDYPQPDNGPIAIATELGPCPWRPENKIVRIGLKAKDLEPKQIPPSNLVFLIDVSGSMNAANKLPLLQQSMHMLADKLTSRDRLSIVVYAGSDRVVLPPTAGDKTKEIKEAITALVSGGSTHASSGITTAYKLARQSFMPGGNNRIILASDGDFNVGVTSRDELERLIVKEKESGVYLTVLGFGMGNYHDDTMEILADKGNGNYSYIDTLLEAKKVLVKEWTSTLFTLAKDVKLQIEFNPAHVGAYRLIGYENRNLADEDFRDDRKDAGEIGAGHTVTALYELFPPGSPAIPQVDRLKYQSTTPVSTNSLEVLTVKLRYKPLEAETSVLLSKPVLKNDAKLTDTGDDFRFAAAVAGFGMLLRHSDGAAGFDYPQLIQLAGNARGVDRDGYRAEFLRLVEMAEVLGSYPQQPPKK